MIPPVGEAVAGSAASAIVVAAAGGEAVAAVAAKRAAEFPLLFAPAVEYPLTTLICHQWVY